MATNFSEYLVSSAVPQTEKLPGREEDMAMNHAGGATFVVDPFVALERFLILGCDGGTYYTSHKQNTLEMFEQLGACIKLNSNRVVDMALNVSDTGRAAKNDPALFALAAVMAFAVTEDERFYARKRLTHIARIGTHILHFAEFINNLKGWGTGTRKAFKQWFLEKTPDEIAYQAIKYASRDGWSLRDLLRKAHPVGNVAQNEVFDFIAHGNIPERGPEILKRVKEVWDCQDDVKAACHIISEHRIPREAIPTELLNSPEVWQALLPHMGLTALIRNLANLAKRGLLEDVQRRLGIAARISDLKEIQRARVHPIQMLNALKVYGGGRSKAPSGYCYSSNKEWTPHEEIVDALELGLERSFGCVPHSDKRKLIALDISGSMSSPIPGSFISAREASGVMALISLKANPNSAVVGFSHSLMRLNLSENDTFRTVIEKISGLPFGSTDCSLPMVYAGEQNLPFDMFEVYTDNETYSGRIHPSEALKLYRKKMGLHSKLAVVATSVSRFSIADPSDPLMMDFVGFDTNTPAAITAFSEL